MADQCHAVAPYALLGVYPRCSLDADPHAHHTWGAVEGLRIVWAEGLIVSAQIGGQILSPADGPRKCQNCDWPTRPTLRSRLMDWLNGDAP